MNVIVQFRLSGFNLKLFGWRKCKSLSLQCRFFYPLFHDCCQLVNKYNTIINLIHIATSSWLSKGETFIADIIMIELLMRSHLKAHSILRPQPLPLMLMRVLYLILSVQDTHTALSDTDVSTRLQIYLLAYGPWTRFYIYPDWSDFRGHYFKGNSFDTFCPAIK